MGSLLRHSLTLLVSLALFASVSAGAPHASAVFEVAGTTYTSPNFGYTVTWPSSWFFIEESSEQGLDFLIVSDGFAIVQFVGGPAFGTPAAELAGVLLTCGSEGTSNCAPVLDETGAPIRGADETRAYATISYDQLGADGLTYSFVNLLEVRTLEPGISLLTSATVNDAAYDSFLSVWDTLLAGIAPAGGLVDPLPDPAADPAPDPVEDTFPVKPVDEVQIPAMVGEPAPVIVSNQWRIAIATTTIGAAIPSLDLEVKEGREWLVIFADVTNWSDLDATFSLGDPLVQTAEMDKPFDLAPSSTRQVARLLGLTSQGNDSAEIAAGVTTRIVLAYSIPAAGTETRLLIQEQVLPIADTFDLAFDPAALPAITGPAIPDLQEGAITGFNGGSSINVTIAGVETAITLIGANVPATGSCYSLQALAELSLYTGATVLLESDAALTSETDRYVWTVNPDGTKSLLNQLLLESGTARYTSTPNAARFAAWLQGTEKAAQDLGAGLWTTCGA
jgi:hypothetical protein